MPGYKPKRKGEMANKTVLIFFSAGIGDAVLMLPLLRKLKKSDYKVTAIFSGIHNPEQIFEEKDLFHSVKVSDGSFFNLFLWILKMPRFDLAIINNFSAGRKNFLLASIRSKKIFTHQRKSHTGLARFISKVVQVDARPYTHDAVQNLLLGGFPLEFQCIDLRKESLSPVPKKFLTPYIVIQAVGNTAAAYKNWPLRNWSQLIDKMVVLFPRLEFVILGDEREVRGLKSNFSKNAGFHFFTQLKLNEISALLEGARFFVGHDGGLMHISVAAGIPTFTIWGPSSEFVYGYEQFDKERHRCIAAQVSCRPCSVWSGGNRSRVDHPEKCPDLACMQTLTHEEVLKELKLFAVKFV